MSWLPLLLAAWIVTDVLVVGAVFGATRKRMRRSGAAVERLRAAGSRGPTTG